MLQTYNNSNNNEISSFDYSISKINKIKYTRDSSQKLHIEHIKEEQIINKKDVLLSYHHYKY